MRLEDAFKRSKVRKGGTTYAFGLSGRGRRLLACRREEWLREILGGRRVEIYITPGGKALKDVPRGLDWKPTRKAAWG